MDALEILLTCLGTSGCAAWISAWYTRKKTDAEADKTSAETDNIISKTYEGIIDNLRTEIDRLSDRVKKQEERELEYLKIINRHREVENDLRREIQLLQQEIASLKLSV